LVEIDFEPIDSTICGLSHSVAPYNKINWSDYLAFKASYHFHQREAIFQTIRKDELERLPVESADFQADIFGAVLHVKRAEM
jgi:hypothetical protein